jgi:hypothetical protein
MNLKKRQNKTSVRGTGIIGSKETIYINDFTKGFIDELE